MLIEETVLHYAWYNKINVTAKPAKPISFLDCTVTSRSDNTVTLVISNRIPVVFNRITNRNSCVAISSDPAKNKDEKECAGLTVKQNTCWTPIMLRDRAEMLEEFVYCYRSKGV